MNAIQALTQRTSSAQLCAPAPSDEQLAIIKQAAIRTADHAYLRPWRFIVLQGNDLDKLGQLFAQAQQQAGGSDEDVARAAKMPLRAPMMIIAIASFKEHPKVPLWEQLVSAGGACQQMLTAAYAQGLGAIWRTGTLAMNDTVTEGLRLTKKEKIVGFLYLGTPAKDYKNLPTVDIDSVFVEGLPL